MQQNNIFDQEQANTFLVENFAAEPHMLALIEKFVEILRREMPKQNLISKNSALHIWHRHIMDSAQLLLHTENWQDSRLRWLDLGSGAGFPSLILAILAPGQFTLVESRSRRVQFLSHVTEELNLTPRVHVEHSRLENVPTFAADCITARAFAPLSKLLGLSARFSGDKTIWLLPKGKNAVTELEVQKSKHRKLFHVEHSITDDEAKILIGQGRINIS